MASADALLHAGDQETFGLVILEAMACGIPVVAVAAGAFTEIVTESCGLLCTPNNPQAMANAVRELFSRGNTRLGQQARHVEQHYAWDTVVDSLLGHYHAVLGIRCPELPMVEPMKPAVLLVLHDVAPSTWADYQPFVEADRRPGQRADDLAGRAGLPPPRTLDAHPAFSRMLSERVARGDELALHGYFHDDRNPARTPRETGSCAGSIPTKASFIRLSHDAALARLRAGIEVFQRHNWPLHGFVAPAWLMSDGTRQALRQLPLSYTSDPQHLYLLPDFTPIDRPPVWSGAPAVPGAEACQKCSAISANSAGARRR
jgi:predicted deacetylase